MATQRTFGCGIDTGMGTDGPVAVVVNAVADRQRPSGRAGASFGLGERPAPEADLSWTPVPWPGARDQGEASQWPRLGVGVGGAASAAAMPRA